MISLLTSSPFDTALF